MISQLIKEYDEQLSFIEAQIEFLSERGKRIRLKKMALDLEMDAYANNTENQVIDCIPSDEELDNFYNTANNGTAQEEES